MRHTKRKKQIRKPKRKTAFKLAYDNTSIGDEKVFSVVRGKQIISYLSSSAARMLNAFLHTSTFVVHTKQPHTFKVALMRGESKADRACYWTHTGEFVTICRAGLRKQIGSAPNKLWISEE